MKTDDVWISGHDGVTWGVGGRIRLNAANRPERNGRLVLVPRSHTGALAAGEQRRRDAARAAFQPLACPFHIASRGVLHVEDVDRAGGDHPYG